MFTRVLSSLPSLPAPTHMPDCAADQVLKREQGAVPDCYGWVFVARLRSPLLYIKLFGFCFDGEQPLPDMALAGYHVLDADDSLRARDVLFYGTPTQVEHCGVVVNVRGKLMVESKQGQEGAVYLHELDEVLPGYPATALAFRAAF